MIDGDGSELQHVFEVDGDGPTGEYPEFCQNCGRIADYIKQWEKISSENAANIFLSTADQENFNSDNLPFLYRALERVHGPQVIAEVKKKWPKVEIIVSEMEKGGTN